MEVKEYLKRIKYHGTLETTPSTLRNLSNCHALSIPFDIFDMFGGKRKVLKLQKIYNDIVVNKRGGFCCENNALLCWLLRELRFEVDILQGQVYIGHSFGPEFDHMTLLVTFDDGGRWMVDVGFGGDGYVLPLKFVDMLEQTQPNGCYRLRKTDTVGQNYVVEKAKKSVLKEYEEMPQHQENNAADPEWEVQYSFDTKPRKLEDFDAMCDYHQDNENSFLNNNTISCIQTTQGRITTFGFVVKKTVYIDPYTERKTYEHIAKNEEELRNIIKKEMGIEIDFKLQVQDKHHAITKADT